MRTMSEARLADPNNPYILSNEIEATRGCTDPAGRLVGDRSNPYVTFAQLEKAEMNKKC